MQSETKDSLTEIKNNLRETTVEWMKLRIKSTIWNKRNQKQPIKNKKKKNPSNDLPTATKAQLQEEGGLSPQKGCTSSTQFE